MGTQPTRLFSPLLLTVWREGYTTRRFFADLAAGLTVAIIALPLAMALGIASIPSEVAAELAAIHPSLTPPAIGLFTAVVAGFFISFLGGSRVQIGGPTAAFIPIVFVIAQKHGYEGLATATLMAGVIVILMGLFRFGALIKFIPYPVTTGFTAGIAVTIFVSQIKDFLGLTILGQDGMPRGLPAEFIPKLQLLAASADSINWQATAVGAGSLALLVLFRRLMPRIPGAIVAVTLSALLVHLLGLDRAAGGMVETIGSRFGDLPSSLPRPHIPHLSDGGLFNPSLIIDLLPAALTIAVLCSIESLLSAVVADGMTGQRHHSDKELIGQGVANIASAFFFGLPATGAIARTVANIKAGGRTPVAGIIHAAALLLFMFFLAPLAKLIPLSALSAVLILVAWNISELDHFRALLRAPRNDVLVLLTTFGLTVLTDLTIAVGVGMVLASLLFMKRMAEVSSIAGVRSAVTQGQETTDPDPKDPGAVDRAHIPPSVEVYEINGPFFFGVADRLKDTLNLVQRPPRVFILRMRYVPHIDATGLHALEEFHDKCARQGTTLLLGGVHAQPLFEFVKVGLDRKIGLANIFDNLDAALERARELVAQPGTPTVHHPAHHHPHA